MPASIDSAGKLRGWTAVTLTMLWAATMAGFAGQLWWPFDLLSSFRPHYVAAFFAIVAGLLQLRRWMLVGAAGIGLAVNAATLSLPVAAVEASVAPAAASSPARLRLLTLNVWFRNGDYDRVASYLAGSGADVIVLQEVDAEQALDLARRLPAYPFAFVEAARTPHGSAVLSRHRIVQAAAVKLAPDGVTVAKARIDLGGQPVTVIGAHLHWPVGPRVSALRNAELDALSRLAREAAGPLLIAGDLNVTPWSPWFARFVESSDLAECTDGAALPGSWPAWFGPAAIRIDHCMMSHHFLPQGTWLGARVGSDHVPVVTDLALKSWLASN